MNTKNLPQHIRFSFAMGAKPGAPIALDKGATDKLADIPRLIRALEASYGTRVGMPKLWAGDIDIEVASSPELFEMKDAMAADLSLTAKEL